MGAFHNAATLPGMPVSKGRKKAKRKPPPPKPVNVTRAKGPSPTWYIVLMFALMGIGALLIVLNYIGLVPGGTTTLNLIIGLALIAVGFTMTLNFR